MAVAGAEFRTIRRQARSALLAALPIVAGFALVTHYAGVARQALPDFSANVVPARFLVPGTGAVVLAMLFAGVLFLCFDARHRDRGVGIVATLDARPVSNLEWLGGRCIAVVLAAWFVALAFALLLLAAGVVGVTRDAGLEPVEPWSLAAFAIGNSLPALALWGGVATLLAAALRQRAVIATAALALLGLYLWWLLHAPRYLLPALSIVPDFGLFASDLTPRFIDAAGAVQRLSLLALAVGLVTLAAALHPRHDHLAPRKYLVGGFAFVLAGGAGIGTLAILATNAAAERVRWADAHAAHRATPVPDLQRLTGKVRIVPGRTLQFEADLRVRAPSVPSRELLFSLNPGMHVRGLEIDGTPVQHSHRHGLLRIVPPREIAASSSLTVSIAGNGKPVPSFAYLDSALDPMSAGVADGYLPILGTQGAIFDEDYAALMPASRWLPMPGANLGAEAQPDFFEIDLVVEVPADWLVAGPGRRHPTESVHGHAVHRFRPAAPVPGAAILAGSFERRATRFGDIELELLLHPKHTRNADYFAPFAERLLGFLKHYLANAERAGIPYPYDALRFVETPGALRGFGGGTVMDTVLPLPGIMALREYGLPTARFNVPPELAFSAMSMYVPADYSGGQPMTGLKRNLLRFQTRAAGDDAYLHDLVLEKLVHQAAFNDFATSFFAARVFQSVPSDGLELLNRLMGSGRAVDDLAEEMAMRSSSRIGLASVSLAELAGSADPEDLTTLEYYARLLARTLRDDIGRQRLAALLSELRRRHLGEQFTPADLAAITEPLQVSISDWLHAVERPGFQMSPVRAYRLADDDQGRPRYQVRVHVYNAEPVAGLVRLAYRQSGDFSFPVWGDPAHVPGNSAVELGILSPAPPVEARIDPYLSLNGREVLLPLADFDTDDAVDAEELIGARASSWRPIGADGDIVVDDLDPAGFALDRSAEAPAALRLPANAKPPPGAVFVDSAEGRWFRQDAPASWGKYRKTLVRATPGDGTRRVVFTAQLPRKGCWRLAWHLPGAAVADLATGLVNVVRPSGLQLAGRRALGWQTLRLVSAGVETSIDFDGTTARHGWNPLGDYALDAGEAHLIVSDRTTGETVVADAARWRWRDAGGC